MAKRFWHLIMILPMILRNLPSDAEEAEPTPPSKPEEQSAVASSTAATRLNCLADFAYPLGGTGLFSQDNKAFYHFSNLGKIRHIGSKNRPSYHYGLHKVDLTRFKSQLLLSVRLPETSIFATYGDPVEGGVAVILSDYDNPCRKGTAQYLSFPLQRYTKKDKRFSVIRGRGIIKLVAGPDYPYLFDIARKSVIEIDFNKLQSRSELIRLSSQEILLYVDLKRRHKYTWQFASEGGTQRGLIAYDSVTNVAGRMRFEPRDRLLQQEKFFGAAQIPLNTNTIRIIELARWSGVKKTKKYEIFLPKPFRNVDANIQVHFAKNIALVSGSTREVQMRWDTVFIFDYAKSLQLASYNTPKNHYTGFAGISPNGELVILEIKNKLTHTSTHLAAFSIHSRKWITIALPTA